MATNLQSWGISQSIADGFSASMDFDEIKLSCIGLACGFILWNWYIDYKNLVFKPTGEQAGLTMWSIFTGIFYMAIVSSCYLILDYADDFMVSFANAVTADIPNGTVSEGSLYSNFSREDSSWYEWLDPSLWIYEAVAYFAAMFVGLIDMIYFMVRDFLLLFMKLVFPLILALAAYEKQRKMAVKFLRTYLALYLVGIGYALAIYFTGFARAGLTEFYAGGGIADLGTLFVILFAKKIMFSEINSLSQRIM